MARKDGDPESWTNSVESMIIELVLEIEEWMIMLQTIASIGIWHLFAVSSASQTISTYTGPAAFVLVNERTRVPTAGERTSHAHLWNVVDAGVFRPRQPN